MPSVGSHSPQSKLSNTWKAWTNFWAKHNGSWKKPLSVHVKSGGNWVKVWDERPVLTSITTYWQPTGGPGGQVLNFKAFTVAANGFSTDLYSDGVFVETVAANTTRTNTYVKGSYYAGDYPVITATNASGSITF